MKFFPPFSLELTLALIKPHASKVPFIVKDVKNVIRKNGFYIVQHSLCLMDLSNASIMYEEHKGKSFYNRLVEMMTSGPINAFLLAREDGIKQWRNVMGPTRSLDAQYTNQKSLRGMYGLSNTRNATHGSDSPLSVFREAGIFFPSFDICTWYEKEEKFFRNGYVKYCEDLGIHCIEGKDAPCEISETSR